MTPLPSDSWIQSFVRKRRAKAAMGCAALICLSSAAAPTEARTPSAEAATPAARSLSDGQDLSLPALEGQIVDRTSGAVRMVALEFEIKVRRIGAALESARVVFGPTRVPFDAEGRFRFGGATIAAPTDASYSALEGGAYVVGVVDGREIRVARVDAEDVESTLGQTQYLVPRYANSPRLLIRSPRQETLAQWIERMTLGTCASLAPGALSAAGPTRPSGTQAATRPRAWIEATWGETGYALGAPPGPDGRPRVRYSDAVPRDRARRIEGAELARPAAVISMVPEDLRFGLTQWNTNVWGLYGALPARFSYDLKLVVESPASASGRGFRAESYVMDFVSRLYRVDSRGEEPRVVWSEASVERSLEFGDAGVRPIVLTDDEAVVRAELNRSCRPSR